jgi:(p)ppGpp synthase/HD superfamily hydrolase
MEYFNDLLKAAIFAADAHRYQTRKYTGEPYVNHPIAVASLVESVGGAVPLQIAALLHDTIEDCGVEADKISQVFGAEVARLVVELTDVSKPSDGNRARRKAIDREHSANASADAKTIKLADLIDNTFSITEHDEGFAKVYMVEKALLLPFLKDGDERLFKMAQAQIDKYFKGGN